MLKYYQAVRGIAQVIADAIDSAVNALRNGQVEQEPAFTGRMIGSIVQALKGIEHKGILWDAKELTDRGTGSQESTFGADFMGVLKINVPKFNVSKGFFAQAKLIRGGQGVLNLNDLKVQCERMLTFSPDSFVFLYSVDGVRIVPAVSVVSAEVDPVYLYSRSPQRFFEEHLQCFIGDRKISEPTPDTLKRLMTEHQVMRGILIEGKGI